MENKVPDEEIEKLLDCEINGEIYQRPVLVVDRELQAKKAEAQKIKSYDKLTRTAAKAPSKRVYICSPLRGNVEHNQDKARIYCRFAFESGYVPICPHIYYPQFLDDDDKNERAAGMRYGLEVMWQARELWVFGERITEGMRAEIELAKDLKIHVKYFDEDMEERA